MNSPVTSFNPIVAPQAKLLILGSMPGVKSLQEQQYYAHPRNAFWQIMKHLLEFDDELNYTRRLEHIQRHGVALWDVAHQCIRPGSLDSEIDRNSVIPNEIARLLKANPSIRAICFNGQTAAKMFKRHFPGLLTTPGISFITLPSTSPAHASLSFADKLAAWHIVKEILRSSASRRH
ncbi:DNA-deoxyinosine glycosylase [Neptunomonas sp.]|uniref:DNA-deoxyinosine glycosylase n=1 Tax=Neptunomonas sp. TaxID=1971898 RepID=UPI00356152A3